MFEEASATSWASFPTSSTTTLLLLYYYLTTTLTAELLTFYSTAMQGGLGDEFGELCDKVYRLLLQ